MFITKNNNYKLHTHIRYNYSIEIMRNKKINKTTLEEYCRIKVDIECVFLFFLNSKIIYTSQTSIVYHIIYKTYKYTTYDLNIKIVIVM